MALVPMKEMLINARRDGYAIGAFEFWSIDSAQAIVEAAQEENVPVILQAGGNECDFACGVKTIYQIAKTVADNVDIPVALHLDHAEDYDFIMSAIDAGFTSVMFDGSKLSFEENIALTQKVVAVAKPLNITVEAELGRLVGVESNISVSDSEAAQTDPDEAAIFVRETGIDALAVAIGTVHGFYTSEPRINIPRLKEIAQKVEIPLVLHGGSGTPEIKLREAIQNGIAKINICTEFVAAFGRTYIETQSMEGFKYNIPGLFGPSKQAGKNLVQSRIRLFKGL